MCIRDSSCGIAERHVDILATILAKDVGEDVGVGVRVDVVECQLKRSEKQVASPPPLGGEWTRPLRALGAQPSQNRM